MTRICRENEGYPFCKSIAIIPNPNLNLSLIWRVKCSMKIHMVP